MILLTNVTPINLILERKSYAFLCRKISNATQSKAIMEGNIL